MKSEALSATQLRTLFNAEATMLLTKKTAAALSTASNDIVPEFDAAAGPPRPKNVGHFLHGRVTPFCRKQSRVVYENQMAWNRVLHDKLNFLLDRDIRVGVESPFTSRMRIEPKQTWVMHLLEHGRQMGSTISEKQRYVRMRLQSRAGDPEIRFINLDRDQLLETAGNCVQHFAGKRPRLDE